MIKIREAFPAEISSINERYAEIQFKLSNPDNEFIILAEWNGQKAGQGRMVKLNSHEAELGGIYVYPEFRKKGIAEKIVQYLLDHSHDFEIVYCLPFEHLEGFYKSFGFKDSEGEVHPEIKEKLEWCLEQYEARTLLLQMKRPSQEGLSLN